MLGLGSGSQLGIGIAIKLQDQFSTDAKKLSSTLKQLKKDSDENIMSAARGYRDHAAGIALGAFALEKGMISMAREGSQLEHTLNKVSVISGEAKSGLKSLAGSLSGEFAQTMDESYGALFENTKSGITKGLDLITRYQVAVSKATDEQLGGETGVAKGLISIMNAMQMTTAEFPRISNAVTAAANASQASVGSLNESMKYSAHTFKQFNVPLEEALALLARLSQSGIEGSAAGTAMQNMFSHLSAAVGPFQTKKQHKALSLLGLAPEDFKDARGNMIPVMDMIRMVEKASSRMNNIDRKEVLSAMFNVRGQRGISNLFGNFDPTKTIESLSAQIKQGVIQDVSINQAKQMTDDLASDFIRLGVSTEQLKQDFSTAAAPVLRFGLYIGTKVMHALAWFTSTGIGKAAASIALVVTPLIGVLFAFRVATITATLAMRAMAMTSGYAGIQRGLMGMAGGPPVTQNVNGLWAVRAGKMMEYEGKMFKGGQLLPRAFGAGIPPAGGVMGNMIGSFFGAGGGMIGQGIGKMGGLLGKILTPISAFMPYLLPISLGIMGLSAIVSALKEPREKLSEDNVDYLRFLEKEVYAKRSSDPDSDMRMQKQFNQNIQISINDQKSFDKNFQHALDEPIQDIGLNLSH